MKILGTLSQVCPYCKTALPRMPARKTKCQSCGNFIFVRTRPQDEKKVLLTAAEAEQLEQQWVKQYEMAPVISERPQHVLSTVESELAKQFGRFPSRRDVLWRVFNDEILEYSSSERWKLYTHVHYEMAELLMSEGRNADALRLYCETFYLLVNGPKNIDPQLASEGFPRFKPHGDPPEYCIKRIVQMLAEAELVPDQIEQQFLTLATELQGELALPLPPAVAWKILTVYL